MKKATCTTFVNILNTIHEEGITTKATLMADQLLYTKFWFALTEFCHFALLSKTGGKSAKGEILPGNSGKIDVLEIRGATTRDEIETDCVIKIIEKLDLVFCQPIEKQKNYCYTICNNMVNDCFRKLPPDDFKIVSLNSTIGGTSVAAEDAYTYEDIIADDTYNPERLHVECETVKELKRELKVKQARELAEKKESILHEVALLSKRPAEVMVRLACTHLCMKPRKLARLIIDKGCELAYAEIIFEVAKQNHIEFSEIRNIIAGHELTAESVKADTNSAEQVAGQISRLVYRADKHLNK
jgi:hypothetical protein|nr:MAG TPA: hypothetical protein [Caudoviricetes sp.]